MIENCLVFKIGKGLKKNPKRRTPHTLKFFWSESSSVLPQTVQSVRCIVHLVTGKLCDDENILEKTLKSEQCKRYISLLLSNRTGMQN